MLPPFIIDQIRRREEDLKQRDEQQPTLEVPSKPVPSHSNDADDDDNDDEGDRGVLIIDLG
ncbi:MAG: hypothetical protein CSA75_05620 [Sorangium cellulosum]|nr:MAG: hypothetical protein CSA75_05620 [Sorangium cellulosum]